MGKSKPVTHARVLAAVKAAAPEMDEGWISKATQNVLGDLTPGEGTAIGDSHRLKRVTLTVKNVSAKDIESGSFWLDGKGMTLPGVSLTDEDLAAAVQRRVETNQK
ncbi:MAG TPA: hypothetical protein VD907_05970 [Verrucomicrobiae bacterium]|nr:hypothetical protein [Verrucomicrobiae bacterium]